MRDSGFDVLVVGAGPVGLTAAHELARRGVRVRLVDRATGPATSSRALATHARTMEICHQMGLLTTLMPRGRKVEHFSFHLRGRRLISFDADYAGMPTRHPFSLMVDQVVTEEVLRKGVHDLGVEVEWEVGLESFEQGADGVTAWLRRADGSVEELWVPWLVGADGARSTVRKQLGLRLLGDSTETWLNADVLLDAPLPADGNHLVHTGKGTLLLVPFPEQDKWRIIDTADIDRADEPEFVRARLAAKLAVALGKPVQVSQPSWISVFTVQQRMIEHMRVGRCFVAGDAAHVHSPASGQGMNTGVQDAYNLAWKLADVIKGHCEEALLDSYEAERVPIGATLLRSTRTATALVALRNALAPVLLPVGLGLVRTIHPLKRRLQRKMIRGFCGLALHYTASPLTVPAGDGDDGIAPGHRVGCDAGTERVSAGWRELYEELTDTRWKLLAAPADAVQSETVESAARAYGSAVSTRAVTDASAPEATAAGEARAGNAVPLADPGGHLRAGLGLRPGRFVLIRPDGYLVAKGELADLPRTLDRVHLVEQQ
ncbi:oxygenase [Spongiactinospora rosea]|uniref:Oxygenase n=1 Tax=Spongiactinospora rosea TaxID=2248750 RepID=A0A366M1N9_9ACTN|nr:FAD-dependent oxidoreductase [Spongiactinospora rosea]RBQ20095.1 oxygenase [Spongiactinospora rosea]